MNGDTQRHVDDSLSRLYKAHTVLADIMMQVDGLVLKAHKMSAHRQICGLDLCSFSQFLADTASSLQEWVPRFEDATHRIPKEDQERKEKDNSTSLRKKKERNDEENAASQDKSWSCVQSENLLDVSVDDTALIDKKNTLSDSPLVPWLDRVQFFILTPMAKDKKTFSPVLLRRCSFKEQESLQSPPPSAITSPGVSHTCEETVETIPAPANASPALSRKSSANVEESISDDPLVSASSTPSRLWPLSFESPDTMNIATPLPPQSLVKRYSIFFEADEHFADSPPMLLITPVVKQNQASQHKPAQEEEEGVEITEYFTAFSPPRLVAARVPMSERGSCSSTLEPLSPQEQAAASAPHLCHEGLRRNAVEHSTPLPPQSLMKRYSRFLQAEEDGEETRDLAMMLTPMLVSSPPKTNLKKPGQPPRLPETVRKTPSSDMQFATVRRAPVSIRRTPLVDLQLSTVRKPGAPLPGEQTLKRELWCRMEAEFASIAHVCKSLFMDGQGESSAEVGRSGIKNRQEQQGLFVPRGLQQRGLNM